jgi:plastocyanin
VLFVTNVYTKVYTIRIGSGTQFLSPKTLNAHVGDTIRFVNYGTFNTTTSVNIPYGARNWDIDLKNFKSHFDIKLDIEGKYEYHSETHKDIVGEIFVKSNSISTAKPYFSTISKTEAEFYTGTSITDDVVIKIYDLLGKNLVDQKIFLTSGKGHFQTNALKKGIYFIKVYHDYKQIFFYKFVKE